MKSFQALAMFAVALIPLGVNAQRAIDGNKVVTTANTIVNEYTTLTADAAAGATTITVAASGLNANTRFGAGNTLAAGDLIMIIQMQGVTANGSVTEYPVGSGVYYGIPNDMTWGVVTSYNNCGRYEFAEVKSVPSATSITVDCGLTYSYTASGRTQVIRVPRYNSLTVNAPGTIIPQAWGAAGSYTGGVVAIEVYGNTVINTASGINANGLGFRGGLSNENNSLIGGGQMSMQNSSEGAEKGEGVYGYQADYNPIGGRYCKGAAGNNGGGGDAHNAGGGGGANAGSLVGYDGLGNPDVSGGAGWVNAWELEAAGFSTHTSPGGGKGGYTWAASSTSFPPVNRDATVLGPGNTSWGGDNRRNQGGYGGRPLDYSTGRIFLGGGGGAGDKNDNQGGNGGAGGGIVYLMSYGTVSGSGSVTANGAAGVNSGVDGAGGGGGGGVVILNSVGTISSISAAANGGAGGNQIVVNSAGSYQESEGPGGGGGGGYIATSNGTITQSATGGVNGTTNCNMLTEFPPNGATKGGAGTTNQLITNDTIFAANQSICSGSTATLTATVYGPISASILWYSAAAGGSSIFSGASFTTPALTTTTTYYVGFCPGTYRYPVTVTVTPGPTVSVNSPSICSGATASLTASGASTYTWSAGVTGTGGATATASPTSTTTYTVSGTNGGCTATQTFTVTVTPGPTVSATSVGICSGQTANLSASGATSYAWSAGATSTGTSTASASPASTTTYTVTGTSAGCSGTATATVTVTPTPSVSVNSGSICSGQTFTLTAAGAAGYTWSAGATPTGASTADVSPASTSTFTVTGTSSGCSATAISTVTVTPSPVVNVNSPNICPGQTALLTASGASSYTWSAGATSTGTSTASASPASTTTYTVTGTSSGCSSTALATVTVNSTADATITAVSPLCVSAAPITLTAAQSGGTWSGTGITNGAAGTFDPATSGAGSFTVTYAIGGACAGSDTAIITVVNTANATINNVLPVCLGSAAFNFTAATSGGTWSGTGITNASTGQFTASVAGTGTFTISYTTGGSCPGTDTTLITVNPNSDATINQPAAQCSGGAPITLTAVSSGGTWTGPGITGSVSGTFSPTIAGVGSHIITYSIGGSCGSSDTVIVVVNPTANSTISTIAPPCVGDAAFNLSAATAGGLWTGAGITDASAGTFDPAAAGVGNTIVTYTLSGACASADTMLISVTPLPDATITSVAPVCPGSATVTLSAATGGGAFSGPGVTGNSFVPSAAGVGTHLINYTIPGGCGNSDTMLIVVNPPVTAVINTAPALCVNSTPVTLTASPAGGTWSGTGVTGSTGLFDPSVSGSGSIAISYGIAGGCGDTTTAFVTVNALPVVTLTSNIASGCAPLCVQFSETGSTACSSVSYNFGNGGSSSSSDPTNCYTSEGVYDVAVTCTDINGCTGSTVIPNMITVFGLPVASFSMNPAGINGAGSTITFTNTSSGSTGGSSEWNFGDPVSTSNQAFTSDAAHQYNEEGNFCVTLIQTSSGGCADTVSDCLVIANEATVSVPNVFTPNGDGNNDDFFITSTSLSSLDCAIYDRWGLKMTEWNTINGFWDGRTNSGNKAPDGVYYYLLKAKAVNGKEFEKQGFVQLINK